MASFDSEPNLHLTVQRGSHTYHQVEHVVRISVKALNLDLERLKLHQANIIKFENQKAHKALTSEQIKARHTAKQLTAVIRQVNATRNQIRSQDVAMFDSKVKDICDKTQQAVDEFLEHYSDGVSPVITSSRVLTENEVLSENNQNVQTQLVITHDEDDIDAEVEALVATEAELEQLEDGLHELHGTIQDFSTIVKSQQCAVDTIEDNVEQTSENVKEGVGYLAQASRYKAAAMPVVGALFGLAVGGPIGLVAGAKIGGAVAIGGGITGYTGAKWLRNKQNKVVETEMEDFEARHNSNVTENRQLKDRPFEDTSDLFKPD